MSPNTPSGARGRRDRVRLPGREPLGCAGSIRGSAGRPPSTVNPGTRRQGGAQGSRSADRRVRRLRPPRRHLHPGRRVAPPDDLEPRAVTDAAGDPGDGVEAGPVTFDAGLPRPRVLDHPDLADETAVVPGVPEPLEAARSASGEKAGEADHVLDRRPDPAPQQRILVEHRGVRDLGTDREGAEPLRVGGLILRRLGVRFVTGVGFRGRGITEVFACPGSPVGGSGCSRLLRSGV